MDMFICHGILLLLTFSHSWSQLLTRLVGHTITIRLASGFPGENPCFKTVHSSVMPCNVLPRPCKAHHIHKSPSTWAKVLCKDRTPDKVKNIVLSMFNFRQLWKCTTRWDTIDICIYIQSSTCSNILIQSSGIHDIYMLVLELSEPSPQYSGRRNLRSPPHTFPWYFEHVILVIV